MSDDIRGVMQVPFRVTYSRDELDGGFVGECLDLPGCMSQGETLDECHLNLIDAIQAVLGTLIPAFATAKEDR